MVALQVRAAARCETFRFGLETRSIFVVSYVRVEPNHESACSLCYVPAISRTFEAAFRRCRNDSVISQMRGKVLTIRGARVSTSNNISANIPISVAPIAYTTRP